MNFPAGGLRFSVDHVNKQDEEGVLQEPCCSEIWYRLSLRDHKSSLKYPRSVLTGFLWSQSKPAIAHQMHQREQRSAANSFCREIRVCGYKTFTYTTWSSFQILLFYLATRWSSQYIIRVHGAQLVPAPIPAWLALDANDLVDAF